MPASTVYILSSKNESLRLTGRKVDRKLKRKSPKEIRLPVTDMWADFRDHDLNPVGALRYTEICAYR